jgi:hypothetical protein
MKVAILIATAVLLAGCGETEVPKPEASMVPAQTCREAQVAVSKATEGNAILLSSPIEATIAYESWLPMPEAQREGLTRAMAIAAVCSEGTPKLDQEIVIRSETGMVLTRRIVQTSFSLPAS